MPQTSNSLLSPTKSMVPRTNNGKQEQRILPTTVNEVIGIKKPYLHKISAVCFTGLCGTFCSTLYASGRIQIG